MAAVAALDAQMPAGRAVWRMALGAALLSSTGIFGVLESVPPTVSVFYRLLFSGAMLLGWVALRV